MSDLIRREDVTEILADLYWADERLLNFKTEIDVVYDKILTLPSADAVEVVRCGECRHKYMKDFDMFCPHMVGILKPNMHCSYGEREGE